MKRITEQQIRYMSYLVKSHGYEGLRDYCSFRSVKYPVDWMNRDQADKFIKIITKDISRKKEVNCYGKETEAETSRVVPSQVPSQVLPEGGEKEMRTYQSLTKHEKDYVRSEWDKCTPETCQVREWDERVAKSLGVARKRVQYIRNKLGLLTFEKGRKVKSVKSVKKLIQKELKKLSDTGFAGLDKRNQELGAPIGVAPKIIISADRFFELREKGIEFPQGHDIQIL